MIKQEEGETNQQKKPTILSTYITWGKTIRLTIQVNRWRSRDAKLQVLANTAIKTTQFKLGC